MKTRDELAETFVVSVLRTFGPDDSAEWEAVVKDGFNLADAFVAERDRRALPPPETPAAEALKFDLGGNALREDGRKALMGDDKWDGYADPVRAVVRICARDQQHAERIVAAMLPVGRGTK